MPKKSQLVGVEGSEQQYQRPKKGLDNEEGRCGLCRRKEWRRYRFTQRKLQYCGKVLTQIEWWEREGCGNEGKEETGRSQLFHIFLK